jgi:hypothetical protein
MIKITDIYDPQVWAEGIAEQAKERNRFIASGIALNTPDFDALASGPGSTVDIPFWKSIDASNEPDYVSDDDTNTSTPEDVSQGIQTARKAFLHKSWGVMDIANEIQGLEDPIGYISNKVGGFWATVDEKRIIASSTGILADSVANHSSDLVVDIATDDAGAPTDAELIGPEAIIDATATMGDAMETLNAIAMHSVVYARLKKNNLITYGTTSDPRYGLKIPYYLDLMVIVDDSLPVSSGTNRYTYTTVLFQTGAFAFGYGSPEYPVEIERKASVGNGGGADVFHSRETNIIHPRGFQFTSASVSGLTPSLAELRDATNWKRVYDYRKNIPVSFLKTNG